MQIRRERYSGDWKSNGGGGGGAFRMTLAHGPGQAWKCEISFDFQGEDVKTTMRTIKVDASRLEATYDFEIEGNALETKLTGQWNGKTFNGSYETASVDGQEPVDDGAWTATLAK
jgi:hypothetical protein